ncbi:MAG: hypothetical protein LBR15_09265 [Methanobrevibacter sp.]|jgi:hypothetical protein|nr:hypothetical protein [Candidatus Methanovirga australis]
MHITDQINRITFKMVHNFQIIGDLDSRFIIDNKIVNTATGYKTINTFNGRIARRYRFSCMKICLLTADNGYYSGENLEYIENQPWDGLIPNKTQASQVKGKEIGKFTKHNFQYDHINDSYQCPNGNILSTSEYQ